MMVALAALVAAVVVREMVIFLDNGVVLMVLVEVV